MKIEDVSVERIEEAVKEVMRHARERTPADAVRELIQSKQFVALGYSAVKTMGDISSPEAILGVFLSNIILGIEVGLKLAETQPGDLPTRTVQ